MKRVIVGMSGGVDSSVSAWLLKQEGYDVIGVTMDVWDGELDDALEAKKVAEHIGIPHYVVNYKEVFQREVIDNFIEEYRRGRTPNPCIRCNRFVKWEVLRAKANELGAEYVSTGHYAQIGRLENGRFAIRSSATADKDQTYVLYALTQEQLSSIVFPVGRYTKPEVRKIAEEAGIPVAHKPDSQEICFVPGTDYAGFIERETGVVSEPGNYVTTDGKILGRHKGIIHYTVGQRKGLDLAMGHRVFVKEIRPETNEVVIAEPEDIRASEVTADSLQRMGAGSLQTAPGEKWTAKVNYHHRGVPCTVEQTGPDEIKVLFDEPVRVVTPGQAVVLYKNGYVMGGGTIRS